MVRDEFLHDACHRLRPPWSPPGRTGYGAVTPSRGLVTTARPSTASKLRLSLAVMDGEKKKLRLSFGYLILGLWAVLLVQQLLSAYLRPTRISYSDFKTAVAQSKIEEVAIGKTLIQGRMKEAPAGAEQQLKQTPQEQPPQPPQQP